MEGRLYRPRNFLAAATDQQWKPETAEAHTVAWRTFRPRPTARFLLGPTAGRYANDCSQ